MPSVRAAAVNAVIRFEASVRRAIELSKYPAYSVYSEPQPVASGPSKTLLPDPVIKEEDMILKSTTITFILTALIVLSAMTVASVQAAGNPAEPPHPCCVDGTLQEDESSEASQRNELEVEWRPLSEELTRDALRRSPADEAVDQALSHSTEPAGNMTILPLNPSVGDLQDPQSGSADIQLNEMDEDVLREINQIRMRLGGGIAGHLQSLPHHAQESDTQGLSADGTVGQPIAVAEADPEAPASTSLERLRDPYGLRQITEDEPVDPWEQLFEQQMRSLIAAELAAGGSAAASPATGMANGEMAGVNRASTDLSPAPAPSDPIEVQRIRDVARDLDDSAADLEELEQFAAADQLREMARKLRERVRHTGGHGATYRR